MYKLQEKSINRSNVLQGIVYVAILAILGLVGVNSMETYELKNNDNNKEELSLFGVIGEANAGRGGTAPKRSQKGGPNRTMPSPGGGGLVLENPSMTPQSLIDEITGMLESACDGPAGKAGCLNGTTKEYWLQDKASFTEGQGVCDGSKKSFTCTEGAFMDGVNVADLTTYKYSECIVGEAAKCIADTNYENNGHSYSTTEIEHGANGTFTSGEVSENDGKYTYDITLDCNDGTLANPSETSPVFISCDENFDESTTTPGLCEIGTKQGTCGGTIPDNAAATTETTFDQTWDVLTNDWNPLVVEWGEDNTTNCDFDCDESFVWDGSICKSNTQECTIENGVGSQGWDDTLNDYGDCSLVECITDFHTEDNLTCITDTKQLACTDSAPTNGTSTSIQVDVIWDRTTWAEPEVCAWTCNTDFHTEDDSTCVSDTKQLACTNIAPTNALDTVTDVDVTWDSVTSEWSIPTDCAWECNTNYTKGLDLCVADTQDVACGGEIPLDATATTATGITQTWSSTVWEPVLPDWSETQATCDFDCDTNYTWNSGTSTCDANTQTCTIENGIGEQEWNRTDWSACMVVSCNDKYSEGNRNCLPDTKEFICGAKTDFTLWNSVESYTQTWNVTERLPADSTPSFNPVISSSTCNFICDNKHDWNPATNVCDPKTEECELSNGTGEHTWQETAWGECSVKTCETGFHTEDNLTCISDSMASCDASNGLGIKTWNSTTSSWGDCEVYRCSDGFYQITAADCKNGLFESGCSTSTTIGNVEICNYNTYLKAQYYYNNDQATAISSGQGGLYNYSNISDACPSGYDVASKDELEQMLETSGSNNTFRTDANLLYVGFYNNLTNSYGSSAYYLTRTYSGTEYNSTQAAYFKANYLWNSGFSTRDYENYSYSVRCIKRKSSGKCTIENGAGIQIWDVLTQSRGECRVDTCELGYHNPGDNTCTISPIGFYSIADSIEKIACTNKPTNSTYLSNGKGKDNCIWECDAGYATTDGLTCESTADKQLIESGCANTITIGDIEICSSNSYFNTKIYYEDSQVSNIQKGLGGLYIYNETSNVCPEGFSLPTDDDWLEMIENSAYGTMESLNSDINLKKSGYYYHYYNKFYPNSTYYFTSTGNYLTIKLSNSSNSYSLTSNTSYHGNIRCIKRRSSRSCSNYYGSGTQTWNDTTNSWNSCIMDSCITDYYTTNSTNCSSVGNGYYSLADSTERVACTTGQSNSSYVTDGDGKDNCIWECNDGYYSADGENCTTTSNKNLLESGCDSTTTIGTIEICNTNSYLNAKSYLNTEQSAAIQAGKGGLYSRNFFTNACPSGYVVPSKFQVEDMITSSSTGDAAGFETDINLITSIYTRTPEGSYYYNYYNISNNTFYTTSNAAVRCIKGGGSSKCLVTKGLGTEQWNSSTNSWDTCQVDTCEAGYYNPGDNTCIEIPVGTYSPADSADKFDCTNKPANSSYVSHGWGVNNCTWSCVTGYYTTDGVTCINN